MICQFVSITMKLCYVLSLLSYVSGQQRGSQFATTTRVLQNRMNKDNMKGSNNFARPIPSPIATPAPVDPTPEPIETTKEGADDYYEERENLQYRPPGGRTASPAWNLYQGIPLIPPSINRPTQPVITPSEYFQPSASPSESEPVTEIVTPPPTPAPIDPPTLSPVTPRPTPQPTLQPSPAPVDLETPAPVPGRNPTGGLGETPQPIVTRTPRPSPGTSNSIPVLEYTDVSTDTNAVVLNREDGEVDEVGVRQIYDVELREVSTGDTYGRLYGVCTRVSQTLKLFSCQLDFDFEGLNKISALGTMKYFGYGSTMNIVGGSGDFTGATGTIEHTWLTTQDDTFQVSFNLSPN
mmetsp:Transcript_13205/g.19429  ORF Transcript_13205/g.19429 Transcript_13205/m.19429 type:complete len:351 (-) Transcript_13205:176-1228(-)